MTYVRISLISAAALSAPWMVYQIWQFVAAGLYPKERKYVTKYVPWSMGLLIAGMVFLYILVLPMILEFFLSFTLGFSLPTSPTLATTMPTLMTIPMVAGDPTPSSLVEGNFWLDTATSQIKVYVNSQIRSLPFTTEGVQPIYTLSEYIDLVLQLLIIFGLAFQLPLVVMAVVSFGLVDIPTLKYFRRHVWFGLIVAAAVVVPGDVVTAMVALFVPMIALFELGIILAGWNKPIETVES
jgi:Sec-independent protein secretion pathway component TatC